MKKIAKEEANELFKLVERHAIQYHDVQIEIVDHYASAIEETWETEPDLSFLEAQKRVYKEFWDFKSLEEGKRKALEKGYEKRLFSALKIWLKLPRIILSILFGGLIFQITKEIDVAIYYLTNFIFYTSLISFFALIYKRKNIEATYQTKFLQLDTAGGIFGLAITFGILSIQWADTPWTFNMGIILAIFAPIWVITMVFGYFQLQEVIENIQINFKKSQ